MGKKSRGNAEYTSVTSDALDSLYLTILKVPIRKDYFEFQVEGEMGNSGQ